VVYLIAGLGNPGREYRDNRHNVGFMVIDQLSEDLGFKLNRVQCKAIVRSGQYNEQKLILAKPQTYMNLSGQAISGLIHFYKIEIADFLVIHDDLDLPLGMLRMRPGGGSAGQKGLGSTIEQLGTQNFARLRVGIGRPPGRMEAADYVLQDFAQGEQEILKLTLEKAAKAILSFVTYGIEHAMNSFNGNIDEV
jgi:peptidyl-tRNA hydrolase, PTH1 family